LRKLRGSRKRTKKDGGGRKRLTKRGRGKIRGRRRRDCWLSRGGGMQKKKGRYRR